MSTRINPNLQKELKLYGKGEWNECFHCGNCTAVCPLTENNNLFPRRSIRLLQMGLTDQLATSVDPWLCYYCGDCSKTCPRDANPGELMMSMRRYLTSLYDWTGLSRRFYTKEFWEFGMIIALALFVISLFIFFLPPLDLTLTESGGVKINQFAPVKLIEIGDWIMAVVVASLLISNILRMYYKVILCDKKIKVPMVSYFQQFWLLIVHFLTQIRFSKCDPEGKRYWYSHWLLMSGYTIMFTLIVVFLPWFQTEEIHPFYHPQRFLGYYATFGLLFGLIFMLIGRIKRGSEKFKFSHFSDWFFIIMLTLTTLTGILVHIFRINGMPYATYYTYIAHLAILVPMIMIEVPFSKWSHLAYRPFAVYFANLKKAAVAR
jgi:ferredoxin